MEELNETLFHKAVPFYVYILPEHMLHPIQHEVPGIYAALIQVAGCLSISVGLPIGSGHNLS